MKTVPFLRTARLDLRPLRPDDARGPYLEWFNDPEVSAGTSHGALPYTEAAALAYIESVHDAPDRLVLAIERREDSAHIGNIALQEINPRYRTAELAIVIGDRTAWGQGYAAEAARALCRHGFRALDLHRIGCGTFSYNAPMRRLADRLGMREEGIRREAAFKDGKRVDVIEYGLLRSEWPLGATE